MDPNQQPDDCPDMRALLADLMRAAGYGEDATRLLARDPELEDLIGDEEYWVFLHNRIHSGRLLASSDIVTLASDAL